MLKGLTVTVLGAGRSGRAAAILADAQGATVSIYDSSETATFEGLPASIVGHAGVAVRQAKSVKSDLVVVSPGIDALSDFASSFAENAKELIGETELGYRYYKGRIIGITGTNGKTTTTEMVETILNQSDISCVACGNYGVPLCEVVMYDKVPDVVALELSSFQLETIDEFRPDVAVWTNFAADHMDRYESIQDYRLAKLRIFENQRSEDTAVVREGENLGELEARVRTFSSQDSSADYYIDGVSVRCGDEVILNLNKTRLRGLHNAENAMAATAATRAIGASLDSVRSALSQYQPPAHRCEYIATVNEVEYINDSKATNLHALASALMSLNTPIVLIAGGKEKGLDYRPLIPLLEGRVPAVVTYGQISQSLAKILSEGAETHRVETLEEAVAVAHQIAPPGSLVLLSPGTSSFDQFSGYEARGDLFRAVVKALAETNNKIKL